MSARCAPFIAAAEWCALGCLCVNERKNVREVGCARVQKASRQMFTLTFMNTTNLAMSEMIPLTLPRINTRLPKRDVVSLISDCLPPCDFVCLLLAGYVSTLLFPIVPFSPAILIGRDSVALIGALLAPFILYDPQFAVAIGSRRTPGMVSSFLMRFVLIAAIAVSIGTAGGGVFDDLPPSWVALWIATGLVFTGAVRFLVARKVRSLERTGEFIESVAIVGAGPLALRLNRHLQQIKPGRVELVGVFDDRPQDAAAESLWPVGRIDELVALSKRRAIDWILVTPAVAGEAGFQAILQQLDGLSTRIALCPPNVGLHLPGKAVDFASDGMPVMLLADQPIKRWDAVLKAGEDALLARLLTLLLLPVLAAIALAIKLDSPGPIIFKQRRHAFNNAEFEIYKFRTMRWQPDLSGDELQQTQRIDRRVTAVGRFLRVTSLDELPQLFNVMKGDMSLVGPRPHAVNMRTEELLGAEITNVYAHRHRVKPGMTGWSQVNGARGATYTTAQLRRRVELDLFYIDHWSLWMDLKILLLTFREVLRRTNAY
jgi:Undecaprenyl-phosphate glucose phosphotransferase